MMSRPKWFLIIVLVAVASLVLAGCERDRPALTVTPAATAPAARGTVPPSPTPPPLVTEVTLSGAAGAAGGQAPAAAQPVVTPTPPAPQQVVISPSTPGGGTGGGGAFFTYTVQAGDTLAQIAARFNVSQEAIVQLNGLSDPNILTVGQKLKIPGTPPADTGTTTTTSPATSIYVVQAGDTLNAIARRFGTTVAELMRLNNLSNPDRIVVGQKLVVPATGGAAPGTGTSPTTGAGQRTHVVQKGETLLSIARRYGVTVQAIQKANNIPNPDLIYPGQVLVIP